jgi:hypothetical protein
MTRRNSRRSGPGCWSRRSAKVSRRERRKRAAEHNPQCSDVGGRATGAVVLFREVRRIRQLSVFHRLLACADRQGAYLHGEEARMSRSERQTERSQPAALAGIRVIELANFIVSVPNSRSCLRSEKSGNLPRIRNPNFKSTPKKTASTHCGTTIILATPLPLTGQQCNFIAGPFIGMLLADYGADVIKVEQPQGGDGIRMGQSKVWCRPLPQDPQPE